MEWEEAATRPPYQLTKFADLEIHGKKQCPPPYQLQLNLTPKKIIIMKDKTN